MLTISRTIADLSGYETIQEAHIAEVFNIGLWTGIGLDNVDGINLLFGRFKLFVHLI